MKYYYKYIPYKSTKYTEVVKTHTLKKQKKITDLSNIVQIGGPFEIIGGKDEVVGGGNQKVGTNN